MSAIASSDVTYSALSRRKVNGSPSRWVNTVTVAFGDGALTYPALGVALLKASMGLPNVIETLKVLDSNADGFVYKWDKANNKIRIYQGPAQTHAHDLKLIGGQAAASTAAAAYYATDILGKEAATDKTIAKADSATKGGVISETLAAAPAVELGSVAVAAKTLILEVSGY